MRTLTLIPLLAGLLFVTPLRAQLAIDEFDVVDVTPNGFTVLIEANEPATPAIAIYEDLAGATDITESFTVTPFALHSGDPDESDPFAADDSVDALVADAQANGVLWLRVQGGVPAETYYFRVTATSGSESASAPDGSLASVTLPVANPFVAEGRYLLVNPLTAGTGIETDGWALVARHTDAAYGVLAFLGDGAAAEQGFVNLNNFFGADGEGLVLSGEEEIAVEFRRGTDGDDFGAVVTVDIGEALSAAAGSSEDVAPPVFIDTDDDGLNDPWEIEHFGDLTRDGTGDFDDDGLTDLAEFAGGADPTTSDVRVRPQVHTPLAGESVAAAAPAAEIFNPIDADGGFDRTFVYVAELSLGRHFGTVLAATSFSSAGDDFRSWLIPGSLTEDAEYTVRVRATGPLSASPWDYRTFRRNTMNAAPGAFATKLPLDGSSTDSATPVLIASASTDADGAAQLEYRFEIYSNAALTALVAESDAIFARTSDGVVSWTADTALDDGDSYWWRVSASDGALTTTTAAVSFSVDLSNGAPPVPVITAPADGAEVATTSVTITVSAGADPDGDPVTCVFHLARVPTLVGPTLVVSPAVPVVAGSASFLATGLLDDTRYWVSCYATDGVSESILGLAEFFVSTVNNAPLAPHLANPIDDAWVGETMPLLAVGNAADADGRITGLDLEVYADEALSVLVASGSTLELTWRVDVELIDLEDYFWRARAIDDDGAEGAWSAVGSFLVNVRVPASPVADAGPTRQARTGNEVVLDGSASQPVVPGLLGIAWSFLATPAASTLDDDAFAPEAGLQPGIVPDVAGEYRVDLFVTDGEVQAIHTAVVVATDGGVRPNVFAGEDRTALVDGTVLLADESVLDPSKDPGERAYAWSFASVPAGSALGAGDITGAGGASASFMPDVAGVYEVVLSVTNNAGIGSDTVVVRAYELGFASPTADAGADRDAFLGDLVTLDGSASYDPDLLPALLSYAWRLVSVPPASTLEDSDIVDATTSLAAITPDVTGTYVFGLTVSDGESSAHDNVAVRVIVGDCAPFDTLDCTVAESDVTLLWSSETLYDAVVVLRDDAEIATLAGDETTYTDTGVAAGAHTYRVEGTCGSSVVFIECSVKVEETAPFFKRGDANGNGVVAGLFDGLFLLRYQFTGGAAPPCMDAADANNNGAISGLLDGLYLLRYQFTEGPAPPAPGPDICGPDPDVDTLDCATISAACE